MKKFNVLSMLFSVAVVASLIVVSACTKEGPAGPAGADGEDGIDGKDGNATCGVCHDNSEAVEIKIAQWGKSTHAIGGTNFENATGCAPCHTSQGFKEVVNTANTSVAAAIEDPSNINCYTCHKIHDTYSTSDWDLRKTEQQTFWLTGTTYDFGKANTCAQCHQPRISYQVPDINNPTGTYTVGSTRFGPHHGPQSSLIAGVAIYAVGTGLNNSTHSTITDACVTCHMASAVGFNSGGHTFKVLDEEEGLNVAGCQECHPDAEAEDLVAEFQPEIQALLDELGVKLEAAGIYNPAGTSGTAVKGDYTNAVAGAYWNFITVVEDRSLGVHNPKFVQKLLENTIESLQ
jgi:hypothetical protein